MKNIKRNLAKISAALLTMTMLSGCGNTKADITSTQLKDIVISDYLTMGDYKNLTVDIAPVADINEEEVDYYVGMYLQNYGGAVEATKYADGEIVKEGDTVNIDFAGVMEEIESEGLSGQGYDLEIGSHSFIEGFEEGLVGLAEGDVVDLELKFPDDYWNTEMAGLPVVFTVTINCIESEEYMNEKVGTIGIDGVTNMSELADYIRGLIESDNVNNHEASISKGITNALVDICEFKELPEELVARYEDFIKKNIETQAAYNGMTSEDFVTQYYNTDLESLAKDYGETTLKQYLAAQAVANAENLNISDEELDASLLENANAAGVETVEEYIKDFSKDNFRDSMMYDKVIDFLKNNTNLVINETAAE